MQENKVAIINKTKEDGLAIQTVGKAVYRLIHDEGLNHYAALKIRDTSFLYVTLMEMPSGHQILNWTHNSCRCSIQVAILMEP